MSTLSDLPRITTAHTQHGATYDLAPLLVNGMESRDLGSVTATVEPNYVFWSCRLRHTTGTDPDNRRIFEGIPPGTYAPGQ